MDIGKRCTHPRKRMRLANEWRRSCKPREQQRRSADGGQDAAARKCRASLGARLSERSMIAEIALITWMVVSVALFAVMSPLRAFLLTYVIGYLILPVEINGENWFV